MTTTNSTNATDASDFADVFLSGAAIRLEDLHLAISVCHALSTITQYHTNQNRKQLIVEFPDDSVLLIHVTPDHKLHYRTLTGAEAKDFLSDFHTQLQLARATPTNHIEA